jgi:hypothetical protein
MSKLYLAKLDVTKIDKSKIFEGKKGKYLDLSIWINDKEDNYGNILSIQQSTRKEEESIYLGNGKEYVKQNSPEPEKTSEQKDDGLPF